MDACMHGGCHTPVGCDQTGWCLELYKLLGMCMLAAVRGACAWDVHTDTRIDPTGPTATGLRRTLPLELLAVLVEGGEILLGLVLCGGTQTLIVLDLPAGRAAAQVLLPGLVLGDRVEADRLLRALARLAA